MWEDPRSKLDSWAMFGAEEERYEIEEMGQPEPGGFDGGGGKGKEKPSPTGAWRADVPRFWSLGRSRKGIKAERFDRTDGWMNVRAVT